MNVARMRAALFNTKPVCAHCAYAGVPYDWANFGCPKFKPVPREAH